MANAAAKKAAAARASSSSTYLPVIAIINSAYIFIRVFLKWKTFDTFQITMSIVLWLLTFVAYKGIMEDASAVAGSSSSKSGTKSKDLVGGSSLDLLGLVVTVQFGSVLLGNFMYWILLIIPIWGIWKLVTTMRGLSGSGGGDDSADAGEVDKDLAAKRQRRAEKRRQKRM